MQLNDDDGDETLADVLWSGLMKVMIVMIINYGRKESEFI